MNFRLIIGKERQMKFKMVSQENYKQKIHI
jgi:hypothetical protein